MFEYSMVMCNEFLAGLYEHRRTRVVYTVLRAYCDHYRSFVVAYVM